VVWSGGGFLRVYSGENASVSDCVNGECHLKGGVERWWEVECIHR
jgi:hypothetical protein